MEGFVCTHQDIERERQDNANLSWSSRKQNESDLPRRLRILKRHNVLQALFGRRTLTYWSRSFEKSGSNSTTHSQRKGCLRPILLADNPDGSSQFAEEVRSSNKKSHLRDEAFRARPELLDKKELIRKNARKQILDQKGRRASSSTNPDRGG